MSIFVNKPSNSYFRFDPQDFELWDYEWQKQAIKDLIGNQCERVEVAGGGGFGTVLKARLPPEHNLHPSLSTNFVAIKSIKFEEDDVNDVKIMKRKEVLREAARNFNHKYILQPLDSVEVRVFNQSNDDDEPDDKYFFIAYEFFPQKDLLSKIFNEVCVKQILFQMIEALQFMYDERQYIHRDIKPENVLIRNYNKKDNIIECVLADLGMLRSLNTIKTNFDCGSSGFQAPEITQRNDIERYSLKSDIYALGKTILYCLTRKTIVGNDEQEVLLSAKNVVISQPLLKLLMEMIHTIPDQRPNYHQIKLRLEEMN